jgi:hypothetical protein
LIAVKLRIYIGKDATILLSNGLCHSKQTAFSTFCFHQKNSEKTRKKNFALQVWAKARCFANKGAAVVDKVMGAVGLHAGSLKDWLI